MNPYRLLFTTLLVSGLLVACTRNRPTEEAATNEQPAETTILSTTAGSGNGEPAVAITTPTSNAPAAALTPEATVTPATIQYTVKEGDTLSSLAQRFQTTLDALRRVNYLTDDNVFIGQILQIPNSGGLTPEGAPTPTPAPYRYTVAQGDSLNSIAAQFGVSAVEIIERNELLNPDDIFVGQELIIPGYATTASAETSPNAESAGESETQDTKNPVFHVVQPGDTFTGIAELYGVDADGLAEANNIANRNQLRVGQKLVIPGVTQLDAAKARGRTHVVQSGESLLSIAEQYNVTPEAILELNPQLADPDQIYVGTELIIPGQ